MSKKFSLALVLLLAAVFLFGMLALSDAFAYQNMSPDGKTCTPCHTDGRTGGAPAKEAPKAPAKEAPAKEAPAKAPAKAAPAKPAPVPKANATLQVTAFGKQATVNGQASGKTLLVPVRAVGDLFYAQVDWDAKAKAVTVQYQGKTGSLTLNKDKATINGKEVALPAKAQTVKGQTYVPVDFFAQIVGAEVSGDTSKGFALNAALPGYAGSQTCGKCHQAQYKDWQNTRHAEMLQDAKDPNAWVIGNFGTNTFFKYDDVDFLVGNGMEGGQRYVQSVNGQLMYMTATWDAESRTWKKANPSKYTCAGCHTAGFNQKTGSWAENGIACESCHGPGAEHAKAPSKANIKNGVGVDMCSSCHGEDRQTGAMKRMWMVNDQGGHLGLFAHEIDNVTAPDYHYGDGCLRCHSATYIVAAKEGKPTPKYDDFMKGALKSDRNGITCVVCHEPHKNTGHEFQLREDPTTTCLQCHTNSQGTPKRGGTVHHPQKQAWEGVLFSGDKAEPVNVKNPKDITCADCHMTDGNHFFKPGTPKVTLESHGKPYEADTCAKCHAAMTAEEVKEWQEAYETNVHDLTARLEAVQAKLKAAKDAGKDVSAAQPYVDATVSNLSIAEHDGSKGLHNVAWTKKVFEQVKADLAKAESLLP